MLHNQCSNNCVIGEKRYLYFSGENDQFQSCRFTLEGRAKKYSHSKYRIKISRSYFKSALLPVLRVLIKDTSAAM